MIVWTQHSKYVGTDFQEKQTLLAGLDRLFAHQKLIKTEVMIRRRR